MSARRWWLFTSVILIGCSHDCIYLPCVAPLAVEIIVTAAGTAGPPPGLAAGWSNNAPQTNACDSSGLCRIIGGIGDYDITLTAPGYQTQQVHAKVTGEEAGCNTCGRVDLQHLNVVMEPVGINDH
jgi:hypothetical protein